jgi:flagellar protein FliS
VIANLNGYQAYQKNKYSTASPHKLITMLYDGAIRFANQAIGYIEQKDIQGKASAIRRFQEIIYELISCLNFKEGKAVADNLYSLYNYTIELSNKSSVAMSIQPLKEAIGIITEIKSAWEQIGKDVQVNG